ncbi:protein phosphatase 2C domain-containing protein [Planctomycetaceae bacterium]|nr:protein phosphatase 2C domain-containing protein [Planctomycetaceae bacterium]MDC0262231.1 protein phosphatase 2C domain-containing protein [Planctomycetaceae bacterium]
MLSDLPLDEFEKSEDFAHLLLVADGIGGSTFGELASRIVIQKIWELATHSASWVMKLKDFDAQQIRERIEAYAQAMQKSLEAEIGSDTRTELSLGTTLTTAYVIGLDAIISHVGDSRAYLLSDGVLKQQTEDQTLARKLMKFGHDEAQVRKFHNILANWFGTGVVGNPVVEIRHLSLKVGDKILLCSDGLTKELTDLEIQDMLNDSVEPQTICDNLLAAALEKGGRDNVTMIVAEVESAR